MTMMELKLVLLVNWNRVCCVGVREVNEINSHLLLGIMIFHFILVILMGNGGINIYIYNLITK